MNKLPLLLRIILAAAMFTLLSALIYAITQDVAFAFTLSAFITWFTFVIGYLVGEEKDKKKKNKSNMEYDCTLITIDLGTVVFTIDKENTEADNE